MTTPGQAVADFDLVVLGGGPAGAAAAITARDLGLSVALVDKAEFPRDKLCGGLVTGCCARQLAAVFGPGTGADLFDTCRQRSPDFDFPYTSWQITCRVH